MKNLKTTIITVLLLLATVSGAVAQEKWEYAVVSYIIVLDKPSLAISINGKEYKETKFEKGDYQGKQGNVDVNPALRAVNELQNEGWEVVNYNGGGFAYSFMLRRKQK